MIKLAANCFNPLHCGAVVASVARWFRHGSGVFVSIPFIAGQWSLPIAGCRHVWHTFVFQSPSLRGSGRFVNTQHTGASNRRVSIPFIAGQWSLLYAMHSKCTVRAKFQSPSLRGSGRFDDGSPVAQCARHVSIPFIAGQWSLRMNT